MRCMRPKSTSSDVQHNEQMCQDMQKKHIGYERAGQLGKKTKEKRKECRTEKRGMTSLGDPRRIIRLTVDCSQHAMGYIQQAHLLPGAM